MNCTSDVENMSWSHIHSDLALHTTVFAKMLPPFEPPHISWFLGPKSESNAKIFTLRTKISWTRNAWNLERTYEGPFLSGFTYSPCWPMEVPDHISYHLTIHPTTHWHFWHGHVSKFYGWLGPYNSAGFPNWNLPSQDNFRVPHVETPSCSDVVAGKSSALQTTKQSKAKQTVQ